MRTAVLTFVLFAGAATVANAQRFTLLPQVGFENSKTTINYNDQGFFAPTGVKFTPQASLRLNYASKQGHGFFLGMATSRSLVSFSFADPDFARTNYSATSEKLQLRLESGYQFNSKPISLGKSKQKTKPSTTSSRQGCGSYAKSHCERSCSSSKSKTSTAKTTAAKSKGSWMRIQPSVGLAYIPGTGTDFVTKSAGRTNYEYRAGNWNTGLLAGAGFEFGRNNNRLFTVGINYFKGIGNLDEHTFTTATATKTTTTKLDSKSSGWNLRVGIPFSLKSTASKSKTQKSKTEKSRCEQYRIQYKCRM